MSAAKIALARWIGNDADAPLAGKPAIDAIRLDPSTLEADLAHRVELAVLAKKEEVAAAEVRITQAHKKADWSVALMYSQRGPAYAQALAISQLCERHTHELIQARERLPFRSPA